MLLTAGVLCTGWNWDYLFDWTILKYQRANGVDRPLASGAANPAVATAAAEVTSGARQTAQPDAFDASASRPRR